MNTVTRLALSLSISVLVAMSLGCDDSSSSRRAPVIDNVNNATEPVGSVDTVIEINGSYFRAAPGEVRFAQGTNVARVVPEASAWVENGIVVAIPAAGDEGAFTVPGVVEVTVVTRGGTSNAIDLQVTVTPVFTVNNVEWGTTTSLPTALRGHQAVAVPHTDTSAYVIVTGGNDGASNVTTVVSNTIAEDGQLGAAWTATTALPAPRAYHGMAAAHPGNSPVTGGSRYIYVIAGQEDETATPGGTDTVFFASVSTVDGTVGAWAQTAPLPETRVGPAVTLYNGHVYVVGGLASDGTPTSTIYTAGVNTDGTLEVWQESDEPYPQALSFATAFGFGGNLYVVGGDAGNSTDPTDQVESALTDVSYARAWNGVLDVWDSTSSIIKRREKHTTWVAYGQVLVAEGVYQGSPGSQELERNVVQSDGTLESWQSITAASKQINANVYNAAALVSPIQPDGAGPRFLLLGGQEFADIPPGALTDAVYYNTAP